MAKHCEMPNCSRPQLVKLEHESTSTVEKYYCPECKRMYPIVTPAGELASLAPLGTFGLFATSMFLGDIEGAINQAKKLLFGGSS